MNFVIAVHGAPITSYAGEHALGFAQAALSDGHQIERIFFLHDGIYHAVRTRSPGPDGLDLVPSWQHLADAGIELAVCIGSAGRRGLVPAAESTPTTTPLAQGFQLAGLGQLIAGIQAADRYLEFPA
jgi:tRNA 2-thiouridine synthesizing protein D